MSKLCNLMSQELAKSLFEYDPVSGCLTWKIAFGKSKPGDAAGLAIGRREHLWIAFGYKQYSVAGIVWVYMTGVPPKGEVDHKNRNGADNRWENLREATRSENQANTRLYKNNRLGVRGVHQLQDGRFRAMISKDGKNKHLGYFDTVADAKAARDRAAMEAHGEFAVA